MIIQSASPEMHSYDQLAMEKKKEQGIPVGFCSASGNAFRGLTLDAGIAD